MQDAGGGERDVLSSIEVGAVLDEDPEDDRQVQERGADGVEPDEVACASGSLRGDVPGGMRRRGEQHRDEGDGRDN